MPIVFAALVPHAPLLIPSIGKAHAARATKTCQALQSIAQDLYASQPESLVFLSPHAPCVRGAFSANVAETYLASLKAFGDLREPDRWRSRLAFGQDLKEQCERHGVPFALRSEAALDYGAVVPLAFFREALADLPLVPLSMSDLDTVAHARFGAVLRELVETKGRRTAIIASGHLSEQLLDAGGDDRDFWHEQFDRTFLDALKQRSLPSLFALDRQTVKDYHSCAYYPLLILLSALGETTTRFTLRSLERPFGSPLAIIDFTLV